MKKIALVLVVVVLLATMSTLLFACTTKVAGKNYVLESFEVTAGEGAEAYIETAKSTFENTYKDAVLTFEKDGKMVVKKGDKTLQTNYYKQDGKNIYVSDTEDVKTDGDPVFVVDGKKLNWSYSYSAGSFKFDFAIILVQQ